MPGENKSMHLSLQHSSLHLCSPLAGIQGQWLERVTGMCFCLLFRAPCCWNWWVFFHSLKRTFYWLYILKMWSEPKSSWECGEKKEWGNLRPPKCRMIENGIWGWGVADNSGRVSMLGAPCTHRKLMAALWDTSPGQRGTSQRPLSALGWSRTCTVTLQGLCIAGVGRSTAPAQADGCRRGDIQANIPQPICDDLHAFCFAERQAEELGEYHSPSLVRDFLVRDFHFLIWVLHLWPSFVFFFWERKRWQMLNSFQKHCFPWLCMCFYVTFRNPSIPRKNCFHFTKYKQRVSICVRPDKGIIFIGMGEAIPCN